MTENVEFNGRTYYWTGRYYQSTDAPRVRLHREVYEHYYGEIPDGKYVHHVDGDPKNNEPENLLLVDPEEHHRIHGPTRDSFPEEAIEAAADWHQSEEGRAWHREHGRRVYEKRLEERDPKSCEVCGENFEDETATGHQRFCSAACKAKHRRESGVDDEERVFEWCGEPFTVNKYAETSHCSRSCAGKTRMSS